MSCDAVVVGAGPAGSVAALVLARAGVRVRLLDRASFPRHKLCGDTINPGALAVLDRLGLGAPVRQRGLPITGMVVTGPGGARVACDYPGGLHGLAITRRDLDVLLLEAAVHAGAEFTPGVDAAGPLVSACGSRVAGVRLQGRASVGSLPARLVVAADGRRSRLAAALGLARPAARPRRWAFGAYFTDVADVGRRGEMHVRGGGYVGVAPLPGGLTNVCVVHPVPHPRRRRWPHAPDVIAAALDADPGLRARFARARQVSTAVALGPLAVDAISAGRPGLLLAGDAAGFVDPMTGDGLRFALCGGELAASAALDELASGRAAFGRLRRARRREFGGKWRINRALRTLADSPRGVRVAAAMAARWGAPVRALVAIAGDVSLARRVCCADPPYVP